jgi:hypothetical protein
VCALLDTEVEAYVHFLWDGKVTTTYTSRRQEVRNVMWFEMFHQMLILSIHLKPPTKKKTWKHNSIQQQQQQQPILFFF